MCPPTSRCAHLSSAGARPSLSPRLPPGHFPVHPAPLQLVIGHLEGLGDRILSRLQQYFYLFKFEDHAYEEGKTDGRGTVAIPVAGTHDPSPWRNGEQWGRKATRRISPSLGPSVRYVRSFCTVRRVSVLTIGASPRRESSAAWCNMFLTSGLVVSTTIPYMYPVSARSGSMVSPTRPDRCVEAANPRGVRQCGQEWDRR